MSNTSSPQETRGMFGHNLKLLIGAQGNIAELARTLDINRTQLNRFLAGESFPRPDLLKRFCDHFRVDARILLEPVENQLEPRGGFQKLLAHYGYGYDYKASERLNDGFYVFWKFTYGRPKRAQAILTQVKTIDGVQTFPAICPKPAVPISCPLTHVSDGQGGLFFLRTMGFLCWPLIPPAAVCP